MTDRIEEIKARVAQLSLLASPAAEVLADGERITALCRASHELASDISYLLDRIAALEGAQQWQPIETAPKDGTVFLAREGLGPDAAHYACAFFNEDEDVRISWSAHCGQYVTVNPEPTHWRPLPEPPAGALAASKSEVA